MHTFIQALREDIWHKIVQHFQEKAEIWVFCGFGTSHMCHGNRAATFPRNYAGIDGVEGARGPAAAAQGEMLTVPAPYISTRHRTAPVTETPGKQPSKQLSRQESQQELNSYFAKSNTTELVKMTSTATSERNGRIPDLKTTTSVSSSTSSAASTGTQESSLLVSKHPLLCSLLSSPSPQQLVVTPRRQQSQEVGVGGGWRSPE